MRNHTLSRRAVLMAAAVLPLAFALPGRLRAETLPLVTVTKDPGCGCCGGWIDHMRAAGFPVHAVNSDEVFALKERLGVPPDLASCHTAEVAGYVIEGHVPATAIRRLLAERPQAIGLATPGMPAGSPGMDLPGTEPESYDVLLFDASGRKTYARFHGAKEI
ncbi:DUF411 domain-containing protein [Paracoccus versutus]|uniref:DUF411 domain-containing protein n=1 Tax=Paracoccus versutus TaxID=34007 RepID=UPI000DF83911|nr:DUF411 domain-containing protein [Paracoccus versutus]RDD68677.1 DUF411 domain-containing protein [Paracoccus versutus]